MSAMTGTADPRARSRTPHPEVCSGNAAAAVRFAWELCEIDDLVPTRSKFNPAEIAAATCGGDIDADTIWDGLCEIRGEHAFRVAVNRHLPERCQVRLALEGDEHCVTGLIDGYHTGPDALRALVGRGELGALRHDHTPADLLRSHEKGPGAMQVAVNRSAPRNVLKRIAHNVVELAKTDLDAARGIARNLATNPHTPAAALVEIARIHWDDDGFTRSLFADHPGRGAALDAALDASVRAYPGTYDYLIRRRVPAT